MAKLNMGEGGIKGLAAQHGEKAALAVVVGISLFLIYSGTKTPGFDKEPNELKDAAARARDHVDRDTHETVMLDPKRNPRSQYVDRTKQGRNDINPGQYPTPKPWRPITVIPSVKREDPETYKPEKLEAMVISRASLAMPKPNGVEDPLEAQKMGRPKDKEEEKKPVKRKRRDRNKSSLGSGGGLGALTAYGLGALSSLSRAISEKTCASG